MATKTEQTIHELAIEVNILKDRVESLRGETEPIREITKKIAVVEHQLSEMTKTRELWSQRGWAILTICLSAFFSLVAAIIVATMIKK